MEDECEDMEQRLHDARMTRKDAEAAELARLKSVNADLLAACEAMLNAQSARRHPLGAPDEGIAAQCAEAASKARAAISKARGQ